MPLVCIYCNEGALDVTAKWVHCDSCQEWVHQKCDEPDMDKSYSGNFYCKLCYSSKKIPSVDIINIDQLRKNVNIS